jgi:hypothetical protein
MVSPLRTELAVSTQRVTGVPASVAVDLQFGAEQLDEVGAQGEGFVITWREGQVVGAHAEGELLAVAQGGEAPGVELDVGAVGRRAPPWSAVAGRKFIAGEPRKPATKRVRGVVDLAGGAGLLDLALVEHEHAVGEGHGLDLVVGDVDAGGAELLVLLADVDADLGAQGGVEVGEGLVEEEQLGAADDGAAHGDALALAAGEGAGEAVEEGLEAEHGGDLGDALVDEGGVGLAQLEAEGEVVADAEVGVERVALEHHGDVAVAGLGAVTSRSPKWIVPLVTSSRPASRRRRVDLPQPLGPTSTAKVPSGMSISTCRSTWVAPKLLTTWRQLTATMMALLHVLLGDQQEAGDRREGQVEGAVIGDGELLLAAEDVDQDGALGGADGHGGVLELGARVVRLVGVEDDQRVGGGVAAGALEGEDAGVGLVAGVGGAVDDLDVAAAQGGVGGAQAGEALDPLEGRAAGIVGPGGGFLAEVGQGRHISSRLLGSLPPRNSCSVP